MSNATLNGRPMPRRTLNDSISRLDEMLDGLAEAIPATVRDTLKESIGLAVAEGVKAALIEVLSHPEIMQRLQPSPAPAPQVVTPENKTVTPPTPASAAQTNSFGDSLKQTARLAAQSITNVATTIHEQGSNVVRTLRWLGSSRKVFGVATGVGVVVAGVAYCSSPFIASAIAGVAGSISTLGIQFGLWFRRSVGRMLVAN